MIESYFIRDKSSHVEATKNDRRGRKEKKEWSCLKGHGLVSRLRELSLDNKDKEGKKKRSANDRLYSSFSLCCRSFVKEDSPCNHDSFDDDLYLREIYNTSDKAVRFLSSEKREKSDDKFIKLKSSGELLLAASSSSDSQTSQKTATITTTSNPDSRSSRENKNNKEENKVNSKESKNKSLSKFNSKLKSPAVKVANKYKVNKENMTPLSARAIGRKSFKSSESFFKVQVSPFRSKPIIVKKDKKDQGELSKVTSKISDKRLIRHKPISTLSPPKHTSTPASKQEKPKASTEPRGKRKGGLFDDDMNLKPCKIARSDPGNINGCTLTGTSFFKPLRDITNFNDFGVCPIIEKQCAACNTYDTPIWRAAEDGTELCNACGIRWKKHHIRCTRCWFIPASRDEKNFEICPSCLNCGTIKKFNTLRRFSSSIY